MNLDRQRRDMSLYDPMQALGRGPHGPGVGSGSFGDPFGGEQQQGESVWHVIDDHMRGRWRWALGLALGLALCLGFLGYRSAVPMYRSTGVIRITQQLPVLVQPTHEQVQFPQNYHNFVNTQLQLMRTARVWEQALLDPELAALPFAKQSNVMRAIKKGLDVDRDPDSELVYVAFDSPDPAVAQAAANAIMRAYDELHGKHGGGNLNNKKKQLNDLLATQARDLGSLRQERQTLMAKYDTTELPVLQRFNMEKIVMMEARVQAGHHALKRAEKSQASSGQVTEMVPPERTLFEINPRLEELWRLRSEAQTSFDVVRNSHKPGADLYVDREQKLATANTIYEQERQKTLDQWRLLGPAMIAAGGTNLDDVVTADDVAALEGELNEMRDQQDKLVADLAKIEVLTYREDQAKAALETTQSRLTNLETESPSLTGFISIVNFGGLPEEPAEDARKKHAIVGMGLGAMSGLGLFFFLGSIDRRAFGVRQISHMPGSRVPPCLGVLPDLGATLSDPENSEVASHCVHQIRNQIEAVRDPKSGYVLAITSPCQGDGKTSIVMALGWSYAAAGYNTLLIDCDLVGRSLTRQMGMVGREGLRDALVARELNGSVSRLPVENLSAVPVGIDARCGPENIRRLDLEQLLEQVRGTYEIILIDTGPMLGALESTPVTAVADGVVLSVRRGRSRNRLEDCVHRLETVGTPCLGVILNCAVRSECNRYVSEASLAAAEQSRIGRGDASPRRDIVSNPGDRNALIRAVEKTTRTRPLND